MTKLIQHSIIYIIASKLTLRSGSKCAKWSKSRHLLRFRRAAIVILAARRLRLLPLEAKGGEFAVISVSPPLSCLLRYGLLSILTKTDAIQFYSTKLLAGNVQQGIQNLLGN